MIFNIIKAYFRSLGFRGILNWIFFAVLMVGIVRSCHVKREYQNKIDSLTSVKAIPETQILKEAKEISKKSDSLGRETVIYKQAEPIIQKIIDNVKLDSIALVAGARADKITAITQIAGTLEKENTDLKRIIAKLNNGKQETVFRYSDAWLSVEGVNRGDTTFRIRNFMANVNVTKVDWSQKKLWVFGRNENRASITFDSPYVRVNGLQTMQLKQKEPLIDFNVEFEGKYLHTPQQILIGPKVGLDVGRFKIGAGYLLNPGGNIGNTLWYGASWKVY